MWSTSPAERTVIVPPDCRWAAVAALAASAEMATVSSAAVTAAPRRPRALLSADIAPPSSGGWSCGFRVEGVADPVAEQVEGEHREQEREPGEEEEPPGGGEDRRGLREHLAPARLRRVDPDAEV